jgi:hypothetical protein
MKHYTESEVYERLRAHGMSDEQIALVIAAQTNVDNLREIVHLVRGFAPSGQVLEQIEQGAIQRSREEDAA